MSEGQATFSFRNQEKYPIQRKVGECIQIEIDWSLKKNNIRLIKSGRCIQHTPMIQKCKGWFLMKMAMCLLLNVVTLCSTPAYSGVELYSQCYKEAAARYRVSSALLKAIGEVESNHNPSAENKHSKARGILQVHSWWWPMLKREYGISAEDLWDACINISVGAWILRQEIDRYGRTWTAVGAYYAGPYKTGKISEYENHYLTYTKKVHKALQNYIR